MCVLILCVNFMASWAALPTSVAMRFHEVGELSRLMDASVINAHASRMRGIVAEPNDVLNNVLWYFCCTLSSFFTRFQFAAAHYQKCVRYTGLVWSSASPGSGALRAVSQDQ